MQYIIGIFLILHGIVHLIGFLVQWKIVKTDEMPYSTKIFAGKFDVGHIGIRIVGLLWLIGALAFIAAGVGLIILLPWWYSLTLYAAVYSLFLSISGWPDARFGVFVNLIILAFLWIGGNYGWLPGI